MRCITSVKYKVLMNGQTRGNIVPEKGLHQGDHLSPFIFILCTEALVSLLNHAENQWKITGMRVTRACPSVSHHLFADDSLSSVRRIPMNVKKWWKESGNMDKHHANVSTLRNPLYSLVRGSTQMFDSRLKNTLGIQNKGGMRTYLGIPEDISGSKCKLLAFCISQGQINE